MKHLKSYENSKNKKLYYIIPTDNIKEELKKIKVPNKVIQDILNNKKNIEKQKYIYIGSEHNWSIDYDWDWMPFKDYDSTDQLTDGEYAFTKDNFTFAGYDNLSPQQIEEIQNIKTEIKLNKTLNKFNL